MSGPRKWGWTQQWNAQRGRCWICLRPMKLNGGADPEGASVEHIVPLSRGGANRWRNKLLAHVRCNSERGAPFVWVKLAAFRRAAMKRVSGLLSETTVDGVDLGCSTNFGAPKRSASPSARDGSVRNGERALRVSLAELSNRGAA